MHSRNRRAEPAVVGSVPQLGIVRDFNLLWAGESVSALGTQFSTLAFPTVAILQLHAGPLEVGVLTGAGFAAYPLLGIAAAPLVDRAPRRKVILGTNAIRAIALGLVTASAAFGTVAFWQLLVAAFVVSGATAVFDTAYQSLLPAIVPREQLLGANSRLETSQNVAYFAGPAAAGIVLQALGAVVAFFADALSYLVALVSVLAIDEDRPAPTLARRTFRADLADGFRAFGQYPFLVPIVSCVGISNAGNMMVRSLIFLLAYRSFDLGPSAVGWALAAGGLSGIAGATAAGTLGRRFGVGATLALATFIEGVAWCIVPLGVFGQPLVVLVAAAALSGFMTPVWNVNNVTLRQRAIPLELQARVVAVARAVGVGTIPLGTVIGGAIATQLAGAFGDRLGLAAAVFLGGLVAGSSVLPLLATGIARIRVPQDAAARA